MKLTVIGCGYVGLTAAACLASAESVQVVGYEIDRLRMEQLQAGICPINEPGLEELLQLGFPMDGWLLPARQKLPCKTWTFF